jgi:hypothetical protein
MCCVDRNKYRNFKVDRTIMGKGLGRIEKIRGDEPNEVLIHVNMEISQGNSLCIYLSLTRKKSCFSFALFFFFFCKIGEQDRRTGILWGGDGGSWYQHEGRSSEDRELEGEYFTKKKCVHQYINVELIPVETIPIIGRRKKSNGGGEFKYDIFDTL